ncbi:MAG TPA: hypothetical protein PKI15_08160 [Candidatus Cloacimonadota bacterium]|nr:hypothetical protein [Candidatus Cloacimonadota bacterium]
MPDEQSITIKGKVLTASIKLDGKNLSKSGKSIVVASSNGFMAVVGDDGTQYQINYNITKRA